MGRTTKEPKTERGKRSIAIDPWLLELLRTEHRRHLAIIAGVTSDSAQVDLSLVRLPPDALVFPSPVQPFDFTRLRCPTAATQQFARHATALGFPIRLHDLRHSHGTILLNKGVPIHEVAGRLGHDAAVLLKTYAHRLPKEDQRSAEIIGAMTSGLT
jgi:integrase